MALAKFQVDFDWDEYADQLGDLRRKMPFAARRMMSKVLSEIKKSIKKEKLRGQVLSKQSGNLLRSIKYTAKPGFYGIFAVNKYYASFHEDGPTTILPQKGTYLTFQIDGEWKRVKQVVLPQRKFAWPVIQEFWTAGKARDLMDMVFQQFLDKHFGEK